jgi:hypothetical protein
VVVSDHEIESYFARQYDIKFIGKTKSESIALVSRLRAVWSNLEVLVGI